MKMRYFLRLSYDGTPFHGWQRQPNAISVQQTLEEALSVILRSDVSVTGAGRTDSGVHAQCMWAHFDAPASIDDKNRFCRSLQRLSGKSIAIHELKEMNPQAHARFDALSRTYRYVVIHKYSPFFKDRAWYAPSDLDYEAMNEAASLLLKEEDFTSFAKLHTDNLTNICKVTNAAWMPEDGMLWHESGAMRFEISANRFLRNMVRSIVGTLVDVGRGKLSINDFKSVIDARDRCAASTSMPAHGLYLWDIKYPDNIFKDSNHSTQL